LQRTRYTRRQIQALGNAYDCAMKISEADWKKFKKLRAIALERFAERILNESQAICGETSKGAHERYGELYRLLQKRNKEMAQAFDDFRRSTATICLRDMFIHGLLTDEELSEFSSEVQRVVRIEH
jgi:hypothetical protein